MTLPFPCRTGVLLERWGMREATQYHGSTLTARRIGERKRAPWWPAIPQKDASPSMASSRNAHGYPILLGRWQTPTFLCRHSPPLPLLWKRQHSHPSSNPIPPSGPPCSLALLCFNCERNTFTPYRLWVGPLPFHPYLSPSRPPPHHKRWGAGRHRHPWILVGWTFLWHQVVGYLRTYHTR